MVGCRFLCLVFRGGDIGELEDKDEKTLRVLFAFCLLLFLNNKIIISVLSAIYLMENENTSLNSKSTFESESLSWFISSPGTISNATLIVVSSSSNIVASFCKGSSKQILSVSLTEICAKNARWSWLILIFWCFVAIGSEKTSTEKA